jgi:hypothetical protein
MIPDVDFLGTAHELVNKVHDAHKTAVRNAKSLAEMRRLFDGLLRDGTRDSVGERH